MKRSIITTIIAGLFLAVILFMNFNIHIVRALRYGSPTIGDASNMNNDTIPEGVYTPWLYAPNHNNDIPAGFMPEMKKLGTTAFLVCTDTFLVCEQYWDGYHKDSLSNSFSVSKSILSLLVGQAIEEEFIGSIDDKVVKYLPEFNHDGNDAITIRHLLAMSSGLGWDENDKTLFSPITEMYYGKDVYKQTVSLTRAEQPGVHFSYASCNAQLLGLILEKATSMPLSFYAASRLWIPLGARNYALWSKDDRGNTKSFCCLNTIARDLGRIGQMMLRGGEWNGLQIIPSGYLDSATSVAPGLRDEANKPNDKYGYMFWITSHKGHKVVYARGILGQYLIIVPDRKLVIVRLGKQRDEHKINEHPGDLYTWIDAGMAIQDRPKKD